MSGVEDAAEGVRRFRPYPEYRPTESELGHELPVHWKIGRLKNLLCPLATGVSVNASATATATPEEVGVLKTSSVYGDVFRSGENKVVIPAELDRVECPVVADSLVISRMNTPELVGSCGFVSDDHPHLYLPDRLWLARAQDDRVTNARFLWYAISSPRTKLRMSSLATGASGSMRCLAQDDFLAISLPVPEYAEQQAIAEFLDRETGKIDALVAKKERLIELLQEKRTALITHAVTKGLDPTAPTKPSGIDWLGDIPAHWDMTRTKALFRLVADHAPEGNDEELLSLYTDIGVRPRKTLEPKGNKATTTDGYFFVRPGDLVVNKILAWMGAIGVSEYAGVTSPAYDILRQTEDLNPKFYHYLFRCGVYLPVFRSRSKGIMDMRLRIYFDQFGPIPVVYPPRLEQDRIVEKLDAGASEIEALTHKVAEAIERLGEFRTALVSAVVTGKIDVREEVGPVGCGDEGTASVV